MASSLLLRLDTTGPHVVQWGAYAGAAAGEFLRVQVFADEPIVSGRVRLADGRWLPVEIFPAPGVTAGELRVQLPPDAQQGWLAFELTDEVLNAALYTNVVHIIGVPAPADPPADPTPTVPPSFPARRAGRPPRAAGERRLITRREVVAASSRASQGSQIRRDHGIAVRSYAGERRIELRLGTLVGVAGMCATRVDISTSSRVGVGRRESKGRRDDEGLLLLLLG